MRYLRRFGGFWWDFVVGDDPTVAVGVSGGIGLAWLVAYHGQNWFWLLPAVVLMTLYVSLRRQTGPRNKRVRRAPPQPPSSEKYSGRRTARPGLVTSTIEDGNDIGVATTQMTLLPIPLRPSHPKEFNVSTDSERPW